MEYVGDKVWEGIYSRKQMKQIMIFSFASCTGNKAQNNGYNQFVGYWTEFENSLWPLT